MEGTQVLAIQQCTSELLAKMNPTKMMSQLEVNGVFDKQDIRLIKGETGVDVQNIAILHAVKRKQAAWLPFLSAIKAEGLEEVASKLIRLEQSAAQ